MIKLPEIHATAVVPGRTPEELWAVVKDSPAFAPRAPHVIGVRVLDSANRESRSTEWTVLLNGSEVTWVQNESTRPGLRLCFEQTAGDLERLAGEWSVVETSAGAQVGLSVSFELGIDGLAPLLNPIWAQSLQAHAEALLRVVSTTGLPANGSDQT
ncbi:type II toxin-antitoxin system RatA family toxin [Kitasatospora aureofaciens]|uniref:type II toxin-antitoxin system RatA family toxin n=1 Tax=Kitasatospora aureofaciens TaxID=1894 RepID=UPI0037C9B99B